MQAGSEEARSYTLGLLLAGLSPEEVETHLAGRLVQQGPRTALSDPTNVMMKEVTSVAQPHERGPVEIKGVTTRVNHITNRTCAAGDGLIREFATYERVARDEHTIESYHVRCFRDEFGDRRLYGA